MTSFNGKNPYNNRVHIDYRRKYVHFKPIKGSWSEATPYRMFFMTINSFLIITSFPIMLIILSLLYFVMDSPIYELQSVTLIWYGFCSLFAWCLSLIYFNKKWRENKFPKFNYYVLTKIRNSTGKKGSKYKLVKPCNVLGNKIFIPHFNNVMFKYKSVGDFTKIKSIDIMNSFDDDPDNWYCQITLNKKPVNGYMEIYYY